jgi:predicted small secreted protein
MSISKWNAVCLSLAAISLAACNTTSERLSGAGTGALVGGAVAGPVGVVVGGVAGAIEGPRVAGEMGVPHRRRHHHWHGPYHATT